MLEWVEKNKNVLLAVVLVIVFVAVLYQVFPPELEDKSKTQLKEIGTEKTYYQKYTNYLHYVVLILGIAIIFYVMNGMKAEERREKLRNIIDCYADLTSTERINYKLLHPQDMSFDDIIEVGVKDEETLACVRLPVVLGNTNGYRWFLVDYGEKWKTRYFSPFVRSLSVPLRADIAKNLLVPQMDSLKRMSNFLARIGADSKDFSRELVKKQIERNEKEEEDYYDE